MLQNSLTNQPEMSVSYDSNGETVKLSPSLVRKYLTNAPNVTDQEIMMFISLCKFQHLNPFIREAYLVKYGNSPATLITGKDVFLKRARKQKDFAGLQAGVIVQFEGGEIGEREGTVVYDDEELVGGWAKVYIKGFEFPFYTSVSLTEYQGLKSDGTPNGQWSSKPATMIRKVALSQALREAYPMETAGLYEPEEVGVNEPPDPIREEAPVAPNVPIEEPLLSPSVEGLLFGGYEG